MKGYNAHRVPDVIGAHYGEDCNTFKEFKPHREGGTTGAEKGWPKAWNSEAGIGLLRKVLGEGIWSQVPVCVPEGKRSQRFELEGKQ